MMIEAGEKTKKGFMWQKKFEKKRKKKSKQNQKIQKLPKIRIFNPYKQIPVKGSISILA